MRPGFWGGYVACFLVINMVQDLYGKEEYLRAVSDCWVNTSWWVWGIGLLIVSAYEANAKR
jgi:hypothetical protein